MTTYRRPLLPAALTLAALLLTACNGNGGAEDPAPTTSRSPLTVTSTAAAPDQTTPTTTTESPATTPVTTPANNPPDEPTDRPLGTPATASETRSPVWEEPAPLVTGVRVGLHENYTRVVYDMIGNGEPGWFSGYIDQPYQDGSGFPVDVAGNAFLMINITGTTYPFEHDHEGMPVGAVPGVGVVHEVNNTGTFEGHTLTYIGLEAELPYSVTVLHDPLRLVVDIQHK